MVAFRSAATATNPAATDASTLTITKPAGTVNGDVMVMVLNATVSATLTTPTGWTLLDGPVDSGTGTRSWLLQRVASSEGASYGITFSAAGPCNGSISSFSGASGIDSWLRTNNGATDPAVSTGIVPTRSALAYDVLAWRDTTLDTGTGSQGTEAFDVSAFNTGSTAARGQVGYYRSSATSAGSQVTANSIDMTNSITDSILWEIAVGDAVPANESWAQTGIAVELEVNSTWYDVTSDVRYAQQISITRGTTAQGSQVNPSVANFTLDNRSGNYSPSNPVSPYFGFINFATPCRISKAYGTVAMDTIGFDDVISDNSKPVDRFRTLSTSSLNITGDIDIRVDAEPETWKQEQVLAAKSIGLPVLPSVNLSSWVFYINHDGVPHFQWQYGTGETSFDVAATSVVPSSVRQTLRVTLDVDNGSSGHTVTFYTSDSVGGTFTQLGSSVVVSGTTSLLTSSAPLTIGAVEPFMDAAHLTYILPGTSFRPFRGRIYAAQVYSGIAGTLVADPTFSSQTSGVRSFTDAESNLWIGYNHAICSNRRYRHHGEVTSWPQLRDTTGNDSWVDLESTGPLQREQQGDNPSTSDLYRFYTNPSGVTETQTDGYSNTGVSPAYFPSAYWPLEDASDSTEISSGLSNGSPGSFNGSPSFAGDSTWKASAPLVTFDGSDDILTFPGAGSVTGSFVVDFLIHPQSGSNDLVYFFINQSGVDNIQFSYVDNGGLEVLNIASLDSNGNPINQTNSTFTGLLRGKHNRITIVASNQNSSIDVYRENVSAGVATLALTIPTSGSVGKVTSIYVQPGIATNFSFGHLAIFDGTLPNAFPYGTGLGQVPPYDALQGNLGEYAADRAKRLVEGQQMVSYNIGDRGDRMGYQLSGTTVDLIRQMQDTDGGYIYEPRNVSGLGYRTRKSMLNAPPVLALDYSAADLSGTFLPLIDNKDIRNDVTVNRIDGNSGRSVVETGELSVNPAPDGVGRYSETVDLSLYQNSDCAQHASWRVFLGTNIDLKVNQVTVALENPRIAASATLTDHFYLADIGDLITIDNLPDLLLPDQMIQQIVGYSEVFDQFTHNVTFNTVPGSSFATGISTSASTSSTQTKADSSTTTLNEDLDTTETGVDVVITSGSAVWTQSGVSFDIVVGGERMTVTAVSGTTSPQTFTVTRSVNGVVKTHSTGAKVSLFKPPIVAL